NRERGNRGVGGSENVNARPERHGTREVHRESPESRHRIGPDVSVRETLDQEEILRRRIVVNTVGAANHGLAGSLRVEREPEARSEVVPVALVERLEPLPDLHQPAARNEIRDAVRFLRKWPDVFESQPEIQSQPLTQLPIILEKRPNIIGERIAP